MDNQAIDTSRRIGNDDLREVAEQLRKYRTGDAGQRAGILADLQKRATVSIEGAWADLAAILLNTTGKDILLDAAGKEEIIDRDEQSTADLALHCGIDIGLLCYTLEVLQHPDSTEEQTIKAADKAGIEYAIRVTPTFGTTEMINLWFAQGLADGTGSAHAFTMLGALEAWKAFYEGFEEDVRKARADLEAGRITKKEADLIYSLYIHHTGNNTTEVIMPSVHYRPTSDAAAGQFRINDFIDKHYKAFMRRANKAMRSRGGNGLDRERPVRAELMLPNYDRMPFSPPFYYVLGQMGNLRRPFSPASKGTRVSRRTDPYDNQITLFQTKAQEVQMITKGLDKISETAQMLFMFGFIAGESQSWRDNRAVFNVRDMMGYMGEPIDSDNLDYFIKKLDRAAKELMSVTLSIRHLDSRGAGKKDTLINAHIVQRTTRERYSGKFELEYDPGILAAARTYFAILPKWAGRISNFAGWRLVLKVYYHMGVSKIGTVQIPNRDILEWLGLPTRKEDVSGRRYSQLMISPVTDAFDAIEAAADGALKIRPSDDASVDSFLSGYTQFEADEAASQHYKSIAAKVKKRSAKEKNAAERGKLEAIKKAAARVEEQPIN